MHCKLKALALAALSFHHETTAACRLTLDCSASVNLE